MDAAPEGVVTFNTETADVRIGVVEDKDVYGAIGEDGFRSLVAAFYRQVPTDDILGPMYPKEDMEGAETRLRDFLIFRFGGPQHYIEHRGHPRLRMRHAPFAVGQAARDRWVALMNRALDEARLPAEAEEPLRRFFESTATFMMNRSD
jgi:hemoglobin